MKICNSCENGTPRVIQTRWLDHRMKYVQCDNCLLQTDNYSHASDALEAWKNNKTFYALDRNHGI